MPIERSFYMLSWVSRTFPRRDYAGFQCPVCGHRRYHRIVVQRDGKRPYPTNFYGCDGCTVLFTDPYTFTQSKWHQTGRPTDDFPDWRQRMSRDVK